MTRFFEERERAAEMLFVYQEEARFQVCSGHRIPCEFSGGGPRRGSS